MARTKGSKNQNQDEIKSQILKYKKEGLDHAAIAVNLEVSKSTIDRYHGILLKEGKVARKRTSPDTRLTCVAEILSESLPGYTEENYREVAKTLASRFKISATR
jgi:transposase